MLLKNQARLAIAIPLAFLVFYGGYKIAWFIANAVMNYCYANGLEDKALAASVAVGVGILQFVGVLVGGLFLKFMNDLMLIDPNESA